MTRLASDPMPIGFVPATDPRHFVDDVDLSDVAGEVRTAILTMQPGLRERPECIGPGLLVRGNAELDADGHPINLTDAELARCNAAALVEASVWLAESEFERLYLLVMGASEPRYFKTVTIPHAGRLPTDRWRAYGWREPPVPVTADMQAALDRASALLGNDAPGELEPAEGRRL